MKEFLLDLIPHCERTLTLIGAAFGAAFSYLFGEWTDALSWLILFMAADYATGTVAALKLGEWASDVGLKGLGRKVIVLVIVAVGHGLDVSLAIHMISIRDIIIGAFIVNEAGSILENLGRIDPHAIPEPIHKMLASLKKRAEKDLSKIEEIGK